MSISELRANRSFDSDTQWHCAAKRAGERMPRGAMPLRAGQLQRSPKSMQTVKQFNV